MASEKGFKIWLEASPETRAKRISQRDQINIKTAVSALKKKDAKTKAIYKELYGFDLGEDFSPFDVIIDVNDLTSKEVLQTLVLIINRCVVKRIEN